MRAYDILKTIDQQRIIGDSNVSALDQITKGMTSEEILSVNNFLLAFISGSVKAEIWGEGLMFAQRIVEAARQRASYTNPIGEPLANDGVKS